MENKKEFQKILSSKAKELAEELKENFKEIKGISISGSVADGIADEYSDIDLDIWLSDKTYEIWAKNSPLIEKYRNNQIKRETPVNYTLLVKGKKFDLTIFSIEKTIEELWRIEQIARRQNSIILYDPENHVKNSLSKKICWINEGEMFCNKEKNTKLSIDFYHFFINAYIDYFVPIALKREQYIQANIDLDFALNLILEYACIINKNFYPDTKSKWAHASKYLDKDIIDTLSEAKLIKSHSSLEIKRRSDLLKKVISDLKIPTIEFSKSNF